MASTMACKGHGRAQACYRHRQTSHARAGGPTTLHRRCRRVGRRKTTLAFLFARSPLAVGMPTQILMTRCTMTHVERAQRPYTAIQRARIQPPYTGYSLYTIQPYTPILWMELGEDVAHLAQLCVCCVGVINIMSTLETRAVWAMAGRGKLRHGRNFRFVCELRLPYNKQAQTKGKAVYGRRGSRSSVDGGRFFLTVLLGTGRGILERYG